MASALSNNPYTFRSMVESMGPPPVIIKLVRGTHGMGVIKSDDIGTAESILEAFYKTKDRALVQRFVPEAKGADVRVFVVNGEVVGVMKRQAKAGEFRSNLHRGGTSTVIALTEEEKEMSLKAAEVLGLSVISWGEHGSEAQCGPTTL